MFVFDYIRFELSLHQVCMSLEMQKYFFVVAHSLSKDSNWFDPSTDSLPRTPRVSQAIVRVDSGPANPKCAPKYKGCKPCVNLVQTKLSWVNLVQTKLLGKVQCER